MSCGKIAAVPTNQAVCCLGKPPWDTPQELPPTQKVFLGIYNVQKEKLVPEFQHYSFCYCVYFLRNCHVE